MASRMKDKPKFEDCDIRFQHTDLWFTNPEHGIKLLVTHIGDEKLEVISIAGKYADDSNRLKQVLVYLEDLKRYAIEGINLEFLTPYLSDADREWLKSGKDFDYIFNREQPEFSNLERDSRE